MILRSRDSVPDMATRLRQRSGRGLAVLAGAVMLIAGCGGTDDASVLTVYSTVTQDTVDAVVDLFTAENPDVSVEVFRAPTGEVTARIASELRTGELAADVFWFTDPLSIQQYEADAMLLEWEPEGSSAVPAEYRTGTFFGTRVLNLVIVHQPGVTVVEDWVDLLEVEGTVALPDPGFAGSAFAALAYFAGADGYGLEFYQRLREAGAVSVQSPGDVVTGVAEGRYQAGITLDRTARDAIDDGSPLETVWPLSGAIAVYSPIAVVAGSDSVDLARAFVEHSLGIEAQEAIARTGWQPLHPEAEWTVGGESVSFDWANAFDRQEELMDEYRGVFGG